MCRPSGRFLSLLLSCLRILLSMCAIDCIYSWVIEVKRRPWVSV
jgi:hypothetical protein